MATVVDNSLILQKLCDKVKIPLISLPPGSASDDNCSICNLAIDASTLHTLKCNHKFHYDCIFGWYKTCADKFMSNSNNFKCQTCPYCRKKGGWLPLKDGASDPIAYVHNDNIKIIEISKKLLKKKSSNPAYVGGSMFSSGPAGPVSANKKAPIVVCSAIQKNGVACKCKASYVDSTGVIKYCGKHQGYHPQVVCKALKKSGQQCSNAAKYANPAGVLTCCGVHQWQKHKF